MVCGLYAYLSRVLALVLVGTDLVPVQSCRNRKVRQSSANSSTVHLNSFVILAVCEERWRRKGEDDTLPKCSPIYTIWSRHSIMTMRSRTARRSTNSAVANARSVSDCTASGSRLFMCSATLNLKLEKRLRRISGLDSGLAGSPRLKIPMQLSRFGLFCPVLN
jgi:hypothetical protein